MKKTKSFRTKIVLTYFTIFSILILVLSLGFYNYASTLLENNAKSNLADASNKISAQTDNLVQSMDYISIDLLSRSNFTSSVAIRDLYVPDTEENISIMGKAKDYILNSITRDSINRTVYRVNVFNTKGDFYSSYDTDNSYEGYSYRNYNAQWLKDSSSKLGGRYLIPSHMVKLKNGKTYSAFSLLRSIEGAAGTVGYLEVQNLTDTLSRIVSPMRNMDVLIIDDKNREVYANTSMDQNLVDYYSLQMKNNSNTVVTKENPKKHDLESLTSTSSQFTGWKIIVIQNTNTLLSSFEFFRDAIIVIGISLILITLAFVYVFSGILTKPLSQLTQYMKNVNINNLSQKLDVKKGSSEILLLYETFQKMQERLDKAIEDEVKAHSLQIKATLDSLQAQINPHFLYNILNVISNRGLEDDDEEICDICAKISEMLRYTTSGENETVTIKDEITHLDNYMRLMKERFEHKLEYKINVNHELENIPIPKLVIQPLVENSIRHGFKGRTFIKITVNGYVEGNYWRIDIIDNGTGFDGKVLSNLEHRMKAFEKEVNGYDKYEGLKIGGMGLVNTFARMSIFYDGKFLFKITNNPSGGACISLGGIQSNH